MMMIVIVIILMRIYMNWLERLMFQYQNKNEGKWVIFMFNFKIRKV